MMSESYDSIRYVSATPPGPDTPMEYGICTLSVVPIRKTPDFVSELTSQLLFGETFEVEDRQPPFLKVRCTHDSYSGWIDGRHTEVAPVEIHPDRLRTSPTLLADTVATVVAEDRTLHLVRGSILPGFQDGSFSIGGRTYRCSGKTVRAADETGGDSIDIVSRLAESYSHTPYKWGGRSPFGIDCSGFVQAVFRFAGVELPRDSADQARCGEPVASLKDARTGDIAFFGSVRDDSDHIGIIVPGGIHHASAFVRVDDLDERGIITRNTGDLSHRLRRIRRLLPDF